MDLQAADNTQLFERIWMSVAGAAGTGFIMFLRHWFHREEKAEQAKSTWDTAMLAQSEKISAHLDAIIAELRTDNAALRARLMQSEQESDRWQQIAIDAKIEVARLNVLLQLAQKDKSQ